MSLLKTLLREPEESFTKDASPASPSPAWPCRACGRPVEIEAVEPSRDGERMLTYWRCDGCPAAGVKPEPMKEPQSCPPQPAPQPAATTRPGNRDFLSRPIGQEENPDVWDAWTPFMLWLLEHHPEHYYAVCDAEDAINALERKGITGGVEYEDACQALHKRFEAARRLKLKAEANVWVQ